MRIQFNQQMNNQINISCINETNTWIFVMPANKREDDDDFNWEDVQLKWTLVEYT